MLVDYQMKHEKKTIQRTYAYDVHYGHELAFSGDFPEQEGCT